MTPFLELFSTELLPDFLFLFGNTLVELKWYPTHDLQSREISSGQPANLIQPPL